MRTKFGNIEMKLELFTIRPYEVKITLSKLNGKKSSTVVGEPNG